MKVKICGIKDLETAHLSIGAGADALGFVFARSTRRITPKEAKAIIKELPASVEKVGVFVNEERKVIEEIASYCGLTMIQLHGEENPEVYQSSKLPLIKAVGIGNAEDVQRSESYQVPYILVDSPKGRYQGGNGEAINWHLLQSISLMDKQLILAGGLDAGNVAEAIKIVRPYMVDVSSGVEADGKKDPQKIKQFIAAAKGEES